jgi:creatinine amidohydrolase
VTSAHRLADHAWTTVAAALAGAAPCIALIPAGATEAHGPHLPLGTDTILSEAVAWRAAELLAARGRSAWVFPAIPYALTDCAASFAGTVSLSGDLAEGIVLAVTSAAQRMGFTAVALVNSHLEAGNIAALRRVAVAHAERTGRPLAFADQTRRRLAEQLGAEFRSGSCHAGAYETSLVLATRPELVDRTTARALPELHVPLHERLRAPGDDFRSAGLSQAYCGAPAAASAEDGVATLDVLARATAEAVEELLATLTATPSGSTPSA